MSKTYRRINWDRHQDGLDDFDDRTRYSPAKYRRLKFNPRNITFED